MIFPLLLNQLRYQTRPTRLMTRTNPRAVVTMEILVKWNVIAPVRVILECFICTEYRSASVRVTQEDIDHPLRKVVRNLI